MVKKSLRNQEVFTIVFGIIFDYVIEKVTDYQNST